MLYDGWKQFNITIIKFKNSPLDIQGEIKIKLKNFKDFTREYILNTYIFNKI